MIASVAALFTRPTSVYRSILGVECFDLARDARTFELDRPVVAHPPCRMWGNFAQWAKGRPDERDLAHWAVHVVRHCGGVLEHPLTSRLWSEIRCLSFGVRDSFGGALVPIRQSWFGHRAVKETGLYIVGPLPDSIFTMGDVERCRLATRTVEQMGRAERESTPPAFARFLVDLAMRSGQ